NDFSNLVTTGASNNKDSNRKITVDTKAAYVQDQLEITKHWKLLAGIRYDDFKADQTDLITTANSAFDSHNQAWSPRAGVVWQPNDAQSYYVSYGESFNPTAETFGTATVTSSKLDPEENRNVEVGTKIELFDGKASFTSALYQLDKTNARTTDPTNADNTILGGETRVKGFELGLAGEVADNFNISAAYSYMDSEVLKSNNTADGSVSNIKKIRTQGMELANVPKHSGTVWATYKLLQNWEIGGGVFASGSRFTDTVEEVKLPGYVRLDGVVAYHQPKYDVQFNLYNLLNKKYYESGQVRSALPGIPLSGMVTVSLKY
ncbi:MAG: TonB-dependent receptor, partial [Methylotenera sp.]